MDKGYKNVEHIGWTVRIFVLPSQLFPFDFPSSGPMQVCRLESPHLFVSPPLFRTYLACRLLYKEPRRRVE